MTGNEFLSKLEHRLRAMPENERQDALEYYRGYLADAEYDEAAAIERLGSPGEVAAKIIAEYALVEAPETEPQKKRSLYIAWNVVLAIFAVPVGLPLAIAVGAVALALLAVIFSLLVAFGASALGLAVGSALSLILGIISLFYDLPLALMVIGGALFVLGVGVLFMKLTAVLAKSGFRDVTRFAGKFILRREKK